MQDDQTLQTMVIDELAWVPNVDAAHIGVAAHDGVVTLSGIVGTLAEKLGAERTAQRVRGHCHVNFCRTGGSRELIRCADYATL